MDKVKFDNNIFYKQTIINMSQIILEEICNYLKNKDFSLSSQRDDGRINSALNEDDILKLIEKKI
jgi:hypothetical protein